MHRTEARRVAWSVAAALRRVSRHVGAWDDAGKRHFLERYQASEFGSHHREFVALDLPFCVRADVCVGLMVGKQNSTLDVSACHL